MKKLMLATVVTFASVSALASKARLESLQNARHIQDIQEVFQREPDQALNYEAATVEFGGGEATAPEAEGGFIRKMGDSAWSLYLGRSSTTYQDFIGGVAEGVAATGGDPLAEAFSLGHQQSNPLQVTYASKMGDIAWGASVFYATSNNKAAETFAGTAVDLNNDGDTADAGETGTYAGQVKQDVGGLLLGANNGVWDAQLRVGLIGSTETTLTTAGTLAGLGAGAGDKLEVDATMSLYAGGGYRMDTMYYYGSYSMGAGEAKLAGTKLADITNNVLEAGAINTIKRDGMDFFYGASVIMTETKEDVGGDKTTSTVVPLLVGVESELNSWLVLRGSISQPLSLLSSTKTTGSGNSTVADATVTRLGAGFKWGRATIDTVIGTGSTGSFGFDDDGDNFAQASVTYAF